MTTVPAHVFRAYDIRGIAGQDITENLCRLVGRGFGSELRERTTKAHPSVIVGRDARTHSPLFERALIEGLLATGCRVRRIGETPSPVNYFTLCNVTADGSIQVTASHNPKEYNGLKLQVLRIDERGVPQAEAFAGDDLQHLRRRIEEERWIEGTGTMEDIDAITPYMERVTSLVNTKGRVVVDTGNGVAGPVYTEALRRAGIEVIGLFTEPDGTFPNHIADPSRPDTLEILQETVRREHADCGIAFDGDGDRVGFVDETGKIVSADLLLLLLAKDHLARHPGAAVTYTVAMSSILESEVRRMGGKPVMCVVGHSFVEHAMREHGSHLGGEQSGHFFCGEDFYDHDDALVAALRVLSIYASPFSSLFSRFPKVYQAPEWRPHCPDEKKAEVIRRVVAHFAERYPCITIDGVRIDFGDGAWAGIRQSNTNPRISVCMEARSEKKLRDVARIVHKHLREYPDVQESVG